jgi:uncharacterized repeat protein (TIGR03943 family)
MAALGRWIEGLLLVLTGGFMLGLIATGTYWSYLNPKFMALTGSAGAGLVLAGILLPLDRSGRGAASRIAVMAVMLALFAVSALDMLRARDAAGTFATPAQDAPAPTHETWNGRKYLRINTAELLMLADERAGMAGKRYVLRGVVTRGGELGPAGKTALVRTAVVCCLADAMAMGFLVAGEPAKELPKGKWAQVWGVLEPLPGEEDAAFAVRIPGSILTVLGEKHQLRVERAEVVKPPKVPYIFEFRKSPPYAY